MVNRKQRILTVHVSYRDFEEDGWFFAECPELQLMEQGKSKREAFDNLADMVISTLVIAIGTDFIDQLLHDLGFKKMDLPFPGINVFDQKIRQKSDAIPLNLDINLPTQLGKDAISVQTFAPSC